MLEIFGKQSDRAFQKSLRILKILQKTIEQLQMNSPVFELGWEIYDGKDPTSCEKIQLCTPKKLCCRRPVLFYHDILWLKVLLTQYLTKKAPGIDKISPRLIKESLPIIAPSITSIINAYLTSGVFPTSRKIAEVCPILKNGDHEKANTYRPISLLPNSLRYAKE